jgi:hypothetical protein
MADDVNVAYGPDGEPLTMREWSELFEARTEVIQTQLESWCHKRTKVGDVEVSTVWLGLDHRFGDDGPPIIWETMTFGGDRDGDQYRYATRGEAFDHHEVLVRELRACVL